MYPDSTGTSQQGNFFLDITIKKPTLYYLVLNSIDIFRRGFTLFSQVQAQILNLPFQDKCKKCTLSDQIETLHQNKEGSMNLQYENSNPG